MNDIQSIGAILLFGCFVTLLLIGYVLRIQYRLLKKYGKDEDHAIRLTLTFASAAILLGTLVPIPLDIAAIYGKTSTELIVLYAISNRVTIVVLSAAFALLYYMASRQSRDK